MPSFAVPAKALRGEGTLEPRPVAIFFTPKTETSSMVKALASKFRDRLSVGQMTTGKSGGRELANTLSHACVASSPGLCIFYVDEASSKSGKHTVIDTYRRKLSSMGLENYGSSSISGGWTCDSPQGEGCGVNELTLALTLTLTNHKAVGG